MQTKESQMNLISLSQRRSIKLHTIGDVNWRDSRFIRLIETCKYTNLMTCHFIG